MAQWQHARLPQPVISKEFLEEELFVFVGRNFRELVFDHEIPKIWASQKFPTIR